ncbi:MAG: hypothetical protein NQU46_06080 [Methanolinea sp.]|nr:hypothetical protein [Methanolinea sp.]
MLLPGTRVMTVAGIALIFGLLLFMVTALVFSVATYNLMVSRRNGWGTKRPLGLFSGTHFFFRTLPQKSPGKKYPGRTAIKEKDAREKSPGPDETGEGRFPR